MEKTVTSSTEVIQQHAALAQRWREPNKMLLGYISAFSADVARKRGPEAAGSMFWPMTNVRVPGPWVRGVGSDLRRAEKIQVTAEMCDVATVMYRRVERNSTRMSVAELPSECGFAWLDDPPPLRDRRGKVSKFRAISWSVLDVPFSGESPVPSARVIFWADNRIEDEYSSGWAPGVLENSERTIGRLQLQHVTLVPLDTDVTGRDLGSSPLADDTVSWLHALFMLLGTTITAKRRVKSQKGVSDRLKRHVKHTDVTVVTLRRAQQPPSEHSGEHREVDWSCQWLVQGHYRHIGSYEGDWHRAVPISKEQNRCVVCVARITWVDPFIKGPDGKPFKTGEVLYRLSR